MPEVRYVGPYPSVDVPEFDLADVTRDAPVSVTDEQAQRLLAQPENWQPVGDDKAADKSQPQQQDPTPAASSAPTEEQ